MAIKRVTAEQYGETKWSIDDEGGRLTACHKSEGQTVEVYRDAQGDLIVFHTEGGPSTDEIMSVKTDTEASALIQQAEGKKTIHQITKTGRRERE